MEISANIPTEALSAVAAAVTEGSTQNGIQSLLSDADSLIKNLYPSTTVTNVAALTWPTTVVIGTKTYTIEPSSSTFLTSTSQTPSSAIASTTENARPIETSAAVSSSTPSSASHSPATRHPWDRRLGIILGVVLGSIAVGLGAFLIWYLHRRRKSTGTFFKRRPFTPSSDEVFSWRRPTESEKYINTDAPPLLQPPMAAHGLYASRTWTRDDDDMHPGYTHTAYQGPAELSAEQSDRGSLHRTTTSEDRQNRPPTPFSPEAFATLRDSNVSPIEQEPQRRRSSGFWPPRDSPSGGYQNLHHSQPTQQPSLSELATSVAQDYPHPYYQNPFASVEDDEYDDYANPYQQNRHLSPPPEIPSRSPRRRSSPMVYYPSEDELGKFDFGLEERREQRPNKGDV